MKKESHFRLVPIFRTFVLIGLCLYTQVARLNAQDRAIRSNERNQLPLSRVAVPETSKTILASTLEGYFGLETIEWLQSLIAMDDEDQNVLGRWHEGMTDFMRATDPEGAKVLLDVGPHDEQIVLGNFNASDKFDYRLSAALSLFDLQQWMASKEQFSFAGIQATEIFNKALNTFGTACNQCLEQPEKDAFEMGITSTHSINVSNTVDLEEQEAVFDQSEVNDLVDFLKHYLGTLRMWRERKEALYDLFLMLGNDRIRENDFGPDPFGDPPKVTEWEELEKRFARLMEVEAELLEERKKFKALQERWTCQAYAVAGSQFLSYLNELVMPSMAPHASESVRAQQVLDAREMLVKVDRYVTKWEDAFFKEWELKDREGVTRFFVSTEGKSVPFGVIEDEMSRELDRLQDEVGELLVQFPYMRQLWRPDATMDMLLLVELDLNDPAFFTVEGEIMSSFSIQCADNPITNPFMPDWGSRESLVSALRLIEQQLTLSDMSQKNRKRFELMRKYVYRRLQEFAGYSPRKLAREIEERMRRLVRIEERIAALRGVTKAWEAEIETMRKNQRPLDIQSITETMLGIKEIEEEIDDLERELKLQEWVPDEGFVHSRQPSNTRREVARLEGLFRENGQFPGLTSGSLGREIVSSRPGVMGARGVVVARDRAPSGAESSKTVRPYIEQLALFPNPASDYVSVIGANEPMEMVILDMIGNMVLERHLNGPLAHRIDLQELPAGVYMVRFFSQLKGSPQQTVQLLVR